MDSEQSILVLATLQGIFHSLDLKCQLQKQHRIFSKAIGVNKGSKNMGEFVVGPYLLDQYAVCYIKQNKLQQLKVPQELLSKIEQTIQRSHIYHVYRHVLKQKKLCLVDGHKFGADFLAYQENPNIHHAKYLVFCCELSNPKDQKLREQVSRLAGICKKIGLLAIKKQIGNQQEIQFEQIFPQKRKERRPETVKKNA